MKINMQKVLRSIAPLFTCFVIVFTMIFPVAAVELVKPEDNISSVVVDGTSKTITVTFDNVPWVFTAVHEGIEIEFTPAAGMQGVSFSDEYDKLTFKILTAYKTAGSINHNGYAFYYGDLPINATYTFSLYTSLPVDAFGPYKYVSMDTMFIDVDGDLGFVGKQFAHSSTDVSDIHDGTIVISSSDDGGSIISKTFDGMRDGYDAFAFQYIMWGPNYSLIEGQDIVYFNPSSYVTFTYDMMEELVTTQGEMNATLKAILAEAISANENLDEISTLLQQILDKLDTVGGCDHSGIEELLQLIADKQDQELSWLDKIWNAIIALPSQIGQFFSDALGGIGDAVENLWSGGDVGDDLDEAGDELTDKNEQLGGAMDDLNDANSALPSTPGDVGSLVDQTIVTNSVTFMTSVLDYEAMGLGELLPLLGVLAGLAVLIYVILGKQG